MITRYLYGTAAATANDVAHIDIPRAGRIVALDWNISFDAEADGDLVSLELSFASAIQVATNDAQGIISTARFFNNLVTSGMELGSIQKTITGIALPVRANERIYLHCLVTSSTFLSQTVFYIV